jgi:acyl-CoA synthetase (NDP forming)
MEQQKREALERMFKPRGLAIIGGVGGIGSFGFNIVVSHLLYGYGGNLYPISAKGGEIAGQKVYRSLEEVPGPIDLASIAVPAPAVPDVLRECIRYGIPGAQIHTSGFAETGEEKGIALQEELLRISSNGFRIVGPNCFGIHCPKGGITLLPGFDYSRKAGPVAMISQSGGIANDFTHEAHLAGIGISKVISFGNGCDLGAVALLDYLSEDPDTHYIAAYLEGVTDGRAFLEMVKRITPRKPVIIWKGGLTPLGSRATMSHTGSMGGEAAIWDAALKQAGAIAVDGLDEMIDTLQAVVYLKNRGRRIALAGGGGAIGVFSSDLASRWGLEIPAFQPETQKILRGLFPTPGNSVVNPLDTGTPALELDILTPMIEAILTRESLDALVMILLIHPLEIVFPAFMNKLGVPPLPPGSYLDSLLETLVRVKKETGKDIVMVLENRARLPENIDAESTLRRVRDRSHEMGIPVYQAPERALRGIRNAAR